MARRHVVQSVEIGRERRFANPNRLPPPQFDSTIPTPVKLVLWQTGAVDIESFIKSKLDYGFESLTQIPWVIDSRSRFFISRVLTHLSFAQTITRP